MSITYAGQPLCVPTPEAQEWVERNLSVQDLFLWERDGWPGDSRSHWTIGSGQAPPRIKLGSLYWPTGASRFSVGYYIVTTPELNLIRNACYSGSVFSAQPLEIVFPQPPSRAAPRRVFKPDMWMLPPRPLASYGMDRYWLLILVDDRYFWWRKTSDLSITEGTTTWATFYADIADALGITITVDAVEAAYVKPPEILNVDNEYLPPLLDTVAYSVGQRIVRTLDGRVLARNYTNSKSHLVRLMNEEPFVGPGGIQHLTHPGRFFT
jgi:hypothetical protein